MNEREIKLIALDLDDTTLDKKGKLTEVTSSTLARAVEAGIHVVVATGRVFAALPNDVMGIKGIEYVITSNGACITRLEDMKILYTACIGPEKIDEIADILEKMPFMIEVFTEGKAYVEKSIYDDIRNYGLSEKHTNYVINTRTPVVGIFDFLRKHKNSIENINVNFQNQEDRARTRKRMEQVENITVTTSFDHNIELGGVSTSKASALRELCGILDVEMEEVMACGDSPNDAAMLKAVGLPIAVGNAKDEVKAAAKYIVGTNDENGVAEAVKKYVLKEGVSR